MHFFIKKVHFLCEQMFAIPYDYGIIWNRKGGIKMLKKWIQWLRHLFVKDTKIKEHFLTIPNKVVLLQSGNTWEKENLSEAKFSDFWHKIWTKPFDRVELIYQALQQKVYNPNTKQEVPIYSQRKIIILQQDGKYALVCFDDTCKTVYSLIADVNTYRTVDIENLTFSEIQGINIKNYAIHQDTKYIKEKVKVLLDCMQNPIAVRAELDQLMVWSWQICTSLPKKYQKLKKTYKADVF